MSATIDVGVIGLGEIGQVHCDVLASMPDVRLVAVADVDAARATVTAERFGAVACTDHRDLLALEGMDAVIVATPDQLHRDVVVDAAGAGVHVLVEKPIATTLEDADAMIAAAERAGTMLSVGFTLRHFPQYERLHDEVRAGRLGTVISAFARRTNLETQSARIGGRTGVLFFLAVHDFDVLRWILDDEPVSIHCAASTSVPGPHPVEDETFTIVRFAGGAVACVHAGWRLPTTHPAGFDFRLDLTGSQGVANLAMEHQGLTIVDG
ncbi:MAG: hypothetical protein RLZZ272_525, partial [Actinomycetota bacterium]